MSASKARYVEMSEPIYDIISKRIRESFPQSCICWIEEIINPSLREAYEARKSKIGNEQQLFHGTSENAVNAIAGGGFDPSYNTVSAYGKGTYFARDASYSYNYMKTQKNGISYMFLCDVLVGRSCLGSNGAVINTEKYDSSVNSLEKPTIFVTPYADGAYPKYIIAFHKTAAK